MPAFIPVSGLSAVAGTRVTHESAVSPLRRPNPTLSTGPATTRMVAYPYTGSGYGGAGIPYANNRVGQLYKITATDDIVDTAASVPIFSTLVSLLAETGLDYELKKGGPFTVFAPVDDAFASLLGPHGFATFGPLLRPENRDVLAKVLAYHVVPGEIDSADITGQSVTLDTVAGDPITVSFRKRKLVAGSATVVRKDLACSNGVIHVIKSVLTPPSFVPPPIRPETPEFPESIIQDVYGKLLTPRQALGIDAAPASGSIVSYFE